MKKTLSLLLVIVLLIGGFVYLGNVVKEKNSNSDLRVTIVVPSEFGDKTYTDSAFEGGDKLIEYGVNVNYIECKGQDYKRQMMEAAAQSDLVVCMGSEFWEIDEVTKEFPSVNFMWIGDTVESPANNKNLLNVVFAENEGSYIVGYVAAAMSKTGVIGAVLENDDSASQALIAGFTQGAKQVNDKINIVVNYADGNYGDEELGKRLANELYIQGADIIYHITGKTGVGVLKAAKEQGFYSIGLGRDMKLDYPEYEDVILCSMKEEIGQAIFTLVKNYYDYGTFDGGQKVTGDCSKRYISIGLGRPDSPQILALDLRNEINILKQEIVNREIKVKTA